LRYAKRAFVAFLAFWDNDIMVAWKRKFLLYMELTLALNGVDSSLVVSCGPGWTPDTEILTSLSLV